MILFMSGFPYSGKTTFAERLIKQLSNKLILHINPKDYYPDNYDKLLDEDRTDIAITAWEMSFETATKAICQTPNRVLIIFDTCCSKSLQMRPLFMNSKLRGHNVLMVYLNATLDDRLSRIPEKDADKFKELEDRYKNNFSSTLPELKPHVDNFYIIDWPNNEREEELNKHVDALANKIKSIRDE